MSRFQFALNKKDLVMRRAGVVDSDSFGEALELLRSRVSATPGDVLELGVSGFPPARFEAVANLMDGSVVWQTVGIHRLAA